MVLHLVINREFDSSISPVGGEGVSNLGRHSRARIIQLPWPQFEIDTVENMVGWVSGNYIQHEHCIGSNNWKKKDCDSIELQAGWGTIASLTLQNVAAVITYPDRNQATVWHLEQSGLFTFGYDSEKGNDITPMSEKEMAILNLLATVIKKDIRWQS